MRRKTHAHHNNRNISTSQEGFISGELKNVMSKNEKIIMGVLVGGILIFLVLSIILLFSRKDKPEEIELPPAISGGSEKVVLTPYPTLPPIENMTVVMNNRRFNPDAFSIPRGGFVDFLNMGTEAISIEAADANSGMLNIGEIGPTETKSVTFETPGTYRFRNKDNPTQIGVITIQ